MYEQFYGLTGKPFQLNPDPSFFFGSRGHRRAYAYMQYGLYQGEGFIVLTGEVGAGKTTLIRNLLQQLDLAKVNAAQLVSTNLDADSLLRAVAIAFGLPVREHDKACLIAELEAYLISLVPEQKRALLIVDEAQNLTPQAVEELRMLSNFQLNNKALLQSFLVGQPELRQLMRSPRVQQFRQRVIASYHLGPLDSDETRAYVEHRLKHVGWTGDPRIEEEAFHLVHAFAGGIPRRINTLCNRLLLAVYLSEKHSIGNEEVEDVIVELNREFGEGATTGPEGTGKVGAGSSENGARTQADAQSAVVVGAADVMRLERRIARVEKAMTTTISLLRQVISATNARSAAAGKKESR
jgi:putative secretion ATPase (PEP-CTERM system associated)